MYPWCKAPDGRSFFAVYLQSALEVWLPVKQMVFLCENFVVDPYNFNTCQVGMYDDDNWKLLDSPCPRFFNYTPENERMSPLYRDYFNRKYIFQPSFFRRYVSLQGGLPHPARCCVNLPFVCNASWHPRGNKPGKFQGSNGIPKKGKTHGKTHVYTTHQIKPMICVLFGFLDTGSVRPVTFFLLFFGIDHMASWNCDHRFLLKLHNCTGLVQKGSKRINVEEGISFLIGFSGTLVWLQTIGFSNSSYDDHGPLQAR